MRNIIAIAVNTVPKRWLSGTMTRPGNSLAAEYTEDRNKAMDFGTSTYAKSVLERLHNPHDRVFTIENFEAVQPQKLVKEGELQ